MLSHSPVSNGDPDHSGDCLRSIRHGGRRATRTPCLAAPIRFKRSPAPCRFTFHGGPATNRTLSSRVGAGLVTMTSDPLVPAAGFEPALYRLSTCSLCQVGVRWCGPDGRIRTGTGRVLNAFPLPSWGTSGSGRRESNPPGPPWQGGATPRGFDRTVHRPGVEPGSTASSERPRHRLSRGGCPATGSNRAASVCRTEALSRRRAGRGTSPGNRTPLNRQQHPWLESNQRRRAPEARASSTRLPLGGAGGNRTPYARIFSPPLYHSSFCTSVATRVAKTSVLYR